MHRWRFSVNWSCISWQRGKCLDQYLPWAGEETKNDENKDFRRQSGYFFGLFSDHTTTLFCLRRDITAPAYSVMVLVDIRCGSGKKVISISKSGLLKFLGCGKSLSFFGLSGRAVDSGGQKLEFKSPVLRFVFFFFSTLHRCSRCTWYSGYGREYRVRFVLRVLRVILVLAA